MKDKISVIILTQNEEKHISRCLTSACKISNNIFIVDSFSTDKTLQIAKKFFTKIYKNKFINYSKQYKWALKNLPINSDWIMRLDADEYLEDGLINELKDNIEMIDKQVVGLNLKRKHIFLNKWIKFGGRYPLRQLRIWRNGHGTIENRYMDEHIIVKGGKTINFKGNFVDHNLNDINFFINKHNKYASREAIDYLIEKYDLGISNDSFYKLNNNSGDVLIKRVLKEKFFNKIPVSLSSLLYFFFRYFIQLGFLDGKEGLIYHFLQGFWYRFLVGVKIFEIEKEIFNKNNKLEIISIIKKKTGFSI